MTRKTTKTAKATKTVKAPVATPAPDRDPRLPVPGSVLEKVFKGKTLRVEVNETGFRHGGEDWRSLTAIALAVTGYGAVSGPRFFGLTKPKSRAPMPPVKTPKPRKRAPKRGKE